MRSALALCVVLSPHIPDLSAIPFWQGVKAPQFHLVQRLGTKERIDLFTGASYSLHTVGGF